MIIADDEDVEVSNVRVIEKSDDDFNGMWCVLCGVSTTERDCWICGGALTDDHGVALKKAE